MNTIKTLEEMPDVQGKRVLVRSELNAPIENGQVADTYRIEQAVPTLRLLSERGARVIVIAHLGRNPSDSLAPVYKELVSLLPATTFVPDLIGERAKEAVLGMQDGDVLLLENVRSNAGEKENSEEFAKALAQLADYYVDDAFGNTHRNHASMTGVPKYIPGYAGLLLGREVSELSKSLAPENPSLCILGGAKFETKEPLLEAILPRYTKVYIGGALANDFLKANGYEVGVSLVSDVPDSSRKLFNHEHIVLPKDVVVEGPGGIQVKAVGDIGKQDKIVDIGPQSIAELGVYITESRHILWNGPLGFYEGGFSKSTEEVAQSIATAEGHSIIGGGDTVAVIRDLSIEDKFDFISTGGGAMLDYLVDGILPGVEALKESPSA